MGGGRYSGEPHVFVSADTHQKPAFGKKGKVLNLGHLDFDIVSNFDISISDFTSPRPSTFVENPLQISSFMQNKPNFQKSQMNVSPYNTTDYENIANWTLGENKPNSNPIKPNCLKAKMDVTLYVIKEYERNDIFAVPKNKPNSNPIAVKAKMNVNLYVIKDYENEPPRPTRKNKPKQTQFQNPIPTQATKKLFCGNPALAPTWVVQIKVANPCKRSWIEHAMQIRCQKTEDRQGGEYRIRRKRTFGIEQGISNCEVESGASGIALSLRQAQGRLADDG